jgi:hypothetical protein
MKFVIETHTVVRNNLITVHERTIDLVFTTSFQLREKNKLHISLQHFFPMLLERTSAVTVL